MNKETSTLQAIDQKTIEKIMDRAVVIDKNCKSHCQVFQIMRSRQHPDTLILRWLSIDISHPERPMQCYRYECFDMDGTPQYCSIHYSNQEEANAFFNSLESLYKQHHAMDHKKN